MNVIIIEDEPLASEHLANMLRKIDPSIRIIAFLESVRMSNEAFQKGLNPDLIFMDIHLSDGLSFELFQSRNIQTPIIFTTAYDEYAIQAFKTNSIDYLLKPINSAELQQALQKFSRLQGLQKTIPDELISLYLNRAATYKTRFLVKSGETISHVNCDAITCFFSEDKHTLLLSNQAKKYVVDYTLDSLEGMLDPALFFRINRKLICSIGGIRKVHSYFNSRLKINLDGIEGDDLIVSRERVAAFKQWLDR